jgi:hypothetical protein
MRCAISSEAMDEMRQPGQAKGRGRTVRLSSNWHGEEYWPIQFGKKTIYWPSSLKLMLSRQGICGLNQFSDPAYFCEVPKPLFTTFPSSDTVSQRFYAEVAANFPAVLEAVSNCLRSAVNTNRHAINSCIDDSLGESLAGESGEAQPQAIDHKLFRFWVDGHPNRVSVKWKKAIEPTIGKLDSPLSKRIGVAFVRHRTVLSTTIHRLSGLYCI